MRLNLSILFFLFVFNHMGYCQSELKVLDKKDQVSIEQNLIPRTGSDVFCEDFENGFDGNSGWGSWTVEDSGGGVIWYEGGSGGPSGPLAGVADPIDSPTMENGYAIFDADLYNDPEAPIMVFGSITSPYLDFSGMESVIVEFYQSYVYCCSNESPIKLEVSINGGTEWFVFDAKGIQKEFSNEFSPNNLLTKVDISCIAADQSNVRVRFSFNRVLNPFQTHYFWMIDDVCIHENEVENDLEIVRVANGDLINGFEHYEVVLDQVTIGLPVSVVFKNNGLLDQIDVPVIVEIYNEDQTEVLHSTSQLFSIYALTNSLDCPYSELDTLVLDFIDLALNSNSNYWLKATLDLATDEVPENNIQWKEFRLNETKISHKVDFDNDYEFRPSSIGENLFEAYTIVSNTKIPYDALFCGIYVEFGPNTDVGAQIELRLYQTDSNDYQDKQEITSIDYTILESDIPTGLENIITFISVDEGSISEFFGQEIYSYGIHFPESDKECTIWAKKDFDCDNSTEIYEMSNDGTSNWYNHQKITPSISLRTGYCTLSVEEYEPTDLLVYPNPVSDNLHIEFPESVEHAGISLYDSRGNMVYAKREALYGNHVNIDLRDLPQGFYSGHVWTGIKMHHFSFVKID